LSQDKKRLLRQVACFRLVFGQRQREPVKGRVKPANNRFEVYFVTHKFFQPH
jgi:hypothetical protein